ncbi:MAG TPA: metal-sulfur cluster assembly factor [Microbacteriaceae bacterium]|nr:metal-sulfur cluster assembly factor [Microbacteriaceae bacterium]
MTPLDAVDVDRVEEALSNVIDPELGIDIVNLGLIYALGWDEAGESLVIRMTLTSAGCPLSETIEEQVDDALDGVVPAHRIDWVWMPPWSPSLATDDGREMMVSLGFTV